MQTARVSWKTSSCMSRPLPSMMQAGLVVAYRRAASLMAPASSQRSAAIFSAAKGSAAVFSSSKPTVCSRTKSASYRSAAMISLIMAMASRPSCPGLICSQMSAMAASLVRMGSMTISLAPCSLAERMASAAWGFVCRSFLPQTRMHWEVFTWGKAMAP